MFHYSKEDGAYLAEVNGVEFLCEEPSKELEKFLCLSMNG